MTGPAVEPTSGPGITTLEDYEAEVAAPKAPAKASEIKLEGDDVPEAYRGKTAAEIMALATATQNALRLSEDARTSLRAAADQPPPPPPPAPVQEEPEMTREQLKDLYDTDPIEAMAKMTEIAEKRATKNMNARLGTMESGAVGMAENWARQEFPDEFKLFEKDIAAVRARIPNPAVFATKQGWEEAIAFVRGQRGNFEKLMEHRRDPARSSVEARAEQATTGGYTGRPTQPTPVPTTGPTVLDATQKQIAQEFISQGIFKTEEEYIKW